MKPSFDGVKRSRDGARIGLRVWVGKGDLEGVFGKKVFLFSLLRWISLLPDLI